MEMSREKLCASKADGSSDSAYHCSACHDDEEWGSTSRGRAKSRSLSASPALGSTKEFRRTRSLHGPCPVTTFGPKACMLQNPKTIMHIQDPASQRLTWNKPPKSVLVIKKIRDASLLQPFKELCVYLTEAWIWTQTSKTPSLLCCLELHPWCEMKILPVPGSLLAPPSVQSPPPAPEPPVP